MSNLTEFEKTISGGMQQWEMSVVALPFGAFKGEPMPTVFLMDCEYDPIFAQFCYAGLIWISNNQDAEWVTLSPVDLKRLAKMSDKGRALCKEIEKGEWELEPMANKP